MAKNVFISFRFSDGKYYKEKLDKVFEESDSIINYSEDQDRSHMSEETIKRYLYDKLKETSVTIVILTPDAIEYKTKEILDGWKYKTVIDDWLYDELRYSLEDRENNRTNGVIAIYTPEAKNLITSETTHFCDKCNFQTSKTTTILDFNNLVRKNMFNVKDEYKQHKCSNLYDHIDDHYIPLISFDIFLENYTDYIDNAFNKRNRINEFNPLVKQIQLN